MSRHYGHMIQMACDKRRLGQQNQHPPQRFVWRGVTYHVAEILAAWHLRDRWWQAKPSGPTAPGEQRASSASSDRYYYRVRCADGLLCDLYYDAISGAWVLDRVHD